MQYAAKEMSRLMSKPEVQDWRAAKRLARYSQVGCAGVQVPGLAEEVVVWSDTEFAGCGRTRRSAAGGVVTLGSHCIKSYSRMQETVELSSCESKFYGIMKAATVGLGVRSLLKDLVLEMEF